MRRVLLSLFLVVSLGVLALGAASLWWVHRPLALPQPTVELSIDKGMLPRQVAQAVADAGVEVSPQLLYAWFRFSGQARDIKAGSYEIPAGTTPRTLLAKLARGDEALQSVTFVEGWTFRQLRSALARETGLRQDTRELSDTALMERLGRAGTHPEGRFFPDTYTFSKGSSDLAVLQRALRTMDRRLEAAWAQRAPDAQAKTPEEALILASIIEKETGRGEDRGLVSAVFNNRLRIGMPLQTDPTVIYGLGNAFTGDLKREHLRADTPWNTYTRGGLPPTPIAMPGKEALQAAVQPAPSKALYFVARGDGSSHFSENLDEHNRAVNKYQRKQ
ncbi:endolytic transglycosylase MltG [Ramlibacter rhizophilus]|uniref:Endolytic murein transglycosylase n=1 Tax=Ramlibacter rhizophilus TaxID=1781167 RepID=A0A4Z0C046_9BURK|nr:endolytic transglycosylase MltG [Ramlibacter rhizophilus]TFZ04967.1 endolytic transglycosylase MltG [Ramlibacter rhizophilus]